MIRYADMSIVSNPGERLKVVYSPRVSETGSISLFQSGVEDVQEFIDAGKDSCEIANIVKRFEATADPSLLQRRVGAFGDFTGAPNTLANALQLQIDSNLLYDGLPSHIKEQFDNDRNKFFVQSGSREWCKIMADYLPESMRIKDEVIVDEQER